MIKKYTVKQILIEGEAVLAASDEKAEKVLNPRFQKLINAASIGAAGASACALYMNRELLIEGFNGFFTYMHNLTNANFGVFTKIYKALTSIVTGGFRLVKDMFLTMGNKAASGDNLAGELKHVFINSKDGLANALGTAGAILGMAALAAIIVIGIYKLFKYIKNALTESLINLSNKQLLNIVKESKNEIKKCSQHIFFEGDLNDSTNTPDNIIKKSLRKLKEMWNWVLTSNGVRKTAIGVTFACIITLAAAAIYTYLGGLGQDAIYPGLKDSITNAISATQ